MSCWLELSGQIHSFPAISRLFLKEGSISFPWATSRYPHSGFFCCLFFFFSQISFRISFSKRECQISRTKALVLMPTVPGWIVCILIYVESSVPKVLKARHFRCVTLRCPLWSLLWKFSECLFNWKSTFLGPSFERKKWKCTVVNRNISAQGEICLSHCDAKIAANSFLLFLLRDSRCSNLCKLIN